MNVGVTDIVAGIRLIQTIYEHGFSERNPADAQYIGFRNDIENLQLLLTELQRSLSRAHDRYLAHLDRTDAPEALDPLTPDFEKERKSIVGDFHKTLLACNALLAENRHLAAGSAGVASRLIANLWQQQDARIDYLRRRIHFHCEKMRLVIDRLSVDLLTNVDANTDDLVGYAEEQALVHEDLQEQLQRIFIALTGGSHNGYGPEPPNARFASPAIEQRFEDWLRVGRPSDLLAGLPLRDAFDAILSTYGQCIELRAQQPLKHLLLLKCMWLILRTKQGIQYQEARPAHYYRRAINRVERGLRMMMRSAQVQVFDEDILLSLPKESFKIWLDPVPAAITALLEPKPQSPLPMEQFVCRLDLAGDGVLPTPSVTVYQRTRHNFRIIKEWWSRDGARITIPQQVCALEDALIPRYALPSSGSSALNLAIYGRHELMDYSFRNLSDLESFQAALVGQDVAHDQTGVGCEFGVRMNAMACDGRVQLWQEPITSRPHAITGTLLDPISDRSTSVDGWSDSTSRRPSIAHSIAQTSTTTSTLEGWISEDIKLPALVIYAQLRSEKPKGQFAIIYILLIDGIDVDYNKCDCGEHYDTCPRLVLSGHKKHGIPIRIIYTGSPHLDNPDPYAFDIFPVRVPRSRGFDRIEVQTTKNVLFNFRNAGLPAKEAFDTALRERFTVRDRQRSNAVETERILRHRADRPSPRSRRSSSSAWPLDFGVVFTNDSRGHGIRLPQAQEEQAEGDFGRSEGAGARPSSHSHQQENAASPHPSTPVQPRVDRRAHVSEDNETVPGHNNEQPDDGLLLSPTSDPEPALSQRSGNSILPPQNGSNSSSGYSDNSGIPTASYNPTALFPRVSPSHHYHHQSIPLSPHRQSVSSQSQPRRPTNASAWSMPVAEGAWHTERPVQETSHPWLRGLKRLLKQA